MAVGKKVHLVEHTGEDVSFMNHNPTVEDIEVEKGSHVSIKQSDSSTIHFPWHTVYSVKEYEEIEGYRRAAFAVVYRNVHRGDGLGVQFEELSKIVEDVPSQVEGEIHVSKLIPRLIDKYDAIESEHYAREVLNLAVWEDLVKAEGVDEWVLFRPKED